MRTWIGLLLGALMFTACTSLPPQSTGQPKDTNGKVSLPSIAQDEPQESTSRAQPSLSPAPTVQVPTVWDQIPLFPSVDPSRFWAPDLPVRLTPQAFDVLPPEAGVYLKFPRYSTYEFEGLFPDTPSEMPVYVAGGYPVSHEEVFHRLVNFGRTDCSFHPGYSRVWCPISKPTGTAAARPLVTERDADGHARYLLGELWMEDYQLDEARRQPDGTWLVAYNQRLVDTLLYIDMKPAVMFNSEGQLTYVQARRRPLVAMSPYPLRTPHDAPLRLQEGKGVAINVLPTPPDGERFKAVRVELAYVMTHANRPKEIVQPHYIFYNQQGQALLIPAVADPLIQWVQ
jgi:hypothetical protein